MNHFIDPATLFRRRVSTHFDSESLVVQEYRGETEINNIVARYKRTGSLPPSRSTPVYDDVSLFQGKNHQEIRELASFASTTLSQAEAEIQASKSASQTPSPDQPKAAEPPSNSPPHTTTG